MPSQASVQSADADSVLCTAVGAGSGTQGPETQTGGCQSTCLDENLQQNAKSGGADPLPADAGLLTDLRSQGLVKPSGESRQKPPALFQLCLTESFRDDKKLIRRLELGKGTSKPSRTLMFLGATGAGKTTSLNALVNHVCGVQWHDPFRLLLIDETGTKENQAHSQTKWVTAYVLHWRPQFKVPYTLVLVDTPGFGDTSGIKRDKEITDQLRCFFQDAIPSLDAIGFVMQSSLPRLTPSQSYVYESVLALFGKDIADNILVLATFADAGQAKVKAALKEAQIPYRKLLKLNNSALFAENGPADLTHDSDSDVEANADFNKMFWDMGAASFGNFFRELAAMTPNSLSSTRDVLKSRKDIEEHIVCINTGLQQGLAAADSLTQEIQVMKKYAAQIAANKDFTYQVTQSKAVQHDLSPGVHVTNCLNCNFTCHHDCAFADDNDKTKCVAMNATGYCTVCPSGCHWQMHKNMRYYFTVESETVTKTAQDVKDQYEAAKKKKLTHSDLVNAMLEDYTNTQFRVSKLLEEVRKSVNLLRKIALRDDPLSQVEYIDQMIMSEQSAKKPGWQSRISQLQVVRKEAELRANMLAESYSPWKDHDASLQSVLVKVQTEDEDAGYWQGLKQRLTSTAKHYFGVWGTWLVEVARWQPRTDLPQSLLPTAYRPTRSRDTY